MEGREPPLVLSLTSLMLPTLAASAQKKDTTCSTTPKAPPPPHTLSIRLRPSCTVRASYVCRDQRDPPHSLQSTCASSSGHLQDASCAGALCGTMHTARVRVRSDVRRPWRRDSTAVELLFRNCIRLPPAEPRKLERDWHRTDLSVMLPQCFSMSTSLDCDPHRPPPQAP